VIVFGREFGTAVGDRENGSKKPERRENYERNGLYF